jgi:hypothetical protein
MSNASVKEELYPALPQIAEVFAEIVLEKQTKETPTRSNFDTNDTN